MTPAPPAPGHTPSQRSLAAIVFTDVVSFSARMHADEVGTFKLLERDFAVMRRLCTEYEGVVLKTTGDGLLLTFTSAVQAVACALAMQRKFAADAKNQAARDTLQHRVGIHLGDILVQNQDVMGDGVNIAARLQAEAEPGGICISQTVYDVVKNKLEMQVVSLGARELKNISQAVPIYHLLLTAQALGSAGAPADAAGLPAVGAPGRKRWPVAAGGAVAVILAVAALLAYRQWKAPAAPVPSASDARAAAPTGDLAGNLATELAQRKDAMRQVHALYLDKYDFNGLVLALRDKGESPAAPAEIKQMLRSAEELQRLKSWLDFALRRYGREHPLAVHDLGGDAAKDRNAYLAADLRMVYLENGTPKPRDWAELKPAEFGALVVSAMQEGREPSRAALLGAHAFARLYALPAMTTALAPLKARRDKDTPEK